MKEYLSIFLTICLCTLVVTGCAANNKNEPDFDNANNADQTVSVEETSTEWEIFLDEYEAFVDDYIEITNQYKTNPTDLTVVNKYTEMAQKVLEWSEKSDKMADELANDPAAAAEFADRLSDIVKKLESIQ